MKNTKYKILNTKYLYIDTHCHLDVKNYDDDRNFLIQKLQEEKIGVITIGTDKKSSIEAVNLANSYENVYATVGYHPTDTEELFLAEEFSDLVKKNKKIVGIGECGLDFFRLKEKLPAGRQEENFIRQIDFAVENNLPIVVHCRDAHKEVIEILKEKKKNYGESLRGVIHFFSGNLEEAKTYLDLGFYFSFGGVLTFSSDYNEVVEFLPLDKILAETDAPFVAPVPYRGKRNEPLFVKEVYKKIAEIKKKNLEEIRVVLNENTFKLFLNLRFKI